MPSSDQDGSALRAYGPNEKPSPVEADSADGVRPRVLHCISKIGLGGAERVAMTIVEGLLAECDFAVFSILGTEHSDVGASMASRLRQLGVQVFSGTRMPVKLGGLVQAAFGLRASIRAFRPSVVHLHTELPEACYAISSTLWRSREAFGVARTIHNSVLWPRWRRLGLWSERSLANAAVACVSQAARQALIQQRRDANVSRPAHERIIYNAVQIRPHAPRSQPQSPAHRKILFAGRLEPQKGADLIPRILENTTVPKGVFAELSVFGDGSCAGALKEFARQPPSGWTMSVAGPVSDLPARLKEFDLVLVPSRFEGIGLIAIEAIMSGVPVVATDAPGLNEVFPVGYPWIASAGNPISFAKAFSAALDGAASWSDQVSRAQKFASERFSLAAMLRDYRAFWHDACVTARHPGRIF